MSKFDHGARRSRAWFRCPWRVAGACVVAALVPVCAPAQVLVPPSPPPAASTLTLDQAVAASLAQHPLIEAARARVEAARAGRTMTAALPNPVATVWVENAGFPGQPLLVGLAKETSAYVTWPFEQLFRRPDRVRQADADIKVADAVAAHTRRQVVAAAVRAFFRVALSQALEDESEENRDRLAQLAAYSRARVNEGVTAEGELLRIEIELDQANTAVVMAEVDLTRSQAELLPYLDPASTPGPLTGLRLSVPDDQAGGAEVLPSVETLLARAREVRPELVAAQARVASATAAAAYERTMSGRQLGATFGGKQFEGRTSMIASLNLAVPVFNRNRGGIARATSERAATDEDLRWAERTVAAEVQGAHQAAVQLTQQVERLRESFLTRAENVHRYTLGAFQEGGASLLQVLDATRVLADARLTYLKTLLAERESLFTLALATGADPTDALAQFHTWTSSPTAGAIPGVRP